jgi:hypothetical protein
MRPTPRFIDGAWYSQALPCNLGHFMRNGTHRTRGDPVRYVFSTGVQVRGNRHDGAGRSALGDELGCG